MDATIRSVAGRDPKKVGQVNAALRALPGEDTSPPAGVDLSGETMKDNLPPLQSEEDQLLFGPTDRPEVPVAGGPNTSGTLPPPAVIRRYLGPMIEASRDPNAPEELHAFLRLLNHHLGG